jgi:hypothetical protein
MGVTIGDGNIFKGVVNIGDNAKLIAKNFNQTFNSTEKIIDLLSTEFQDHYESADKDQILSELAELKKALQTTPAEEHSGIIKRVFKKIEPALHVIAGVSSIAGLIVALL